MEFEADKYTEDVIQVYLDLPGTVPAITNSMELLKELLERVYRDGWIDGYKEGLEDEPHV